MAWLAAGEPARPSADDISKEVVSCIATAARRFNTLGEGAEVTARAVEGECREVTRKWGEQFALEMSLKHGANFAKMKEFTSKQSEQFLRDTALGAVMRLREQQIRKADEDAPSPTSGN